LSIQEDFFRHTEGVVFLAGMKKEKFAWIGILMELFYCHKKMDWVQLPVVE